LKKMGKPGRFFTRKWSLGTGIPILGLVSIIMLLFEVGVLLLYFGSISLLGVVGPVLKVPSLLMTWVGCVIAAMLCFLAFTGTLFCVLGLVSHKSFFKWLLISLSLLGVIALPVVIYYRDRVDDFAALATMLYALTGWSVLLFVTTLIAFSYIEAMPLKQQVPEDWSES
jgi:hypothetical protein